MKETDIIKSLQIYYPLLREGYGTEYERFALNKFVARTVDRYDISTVLEMPANGVMGIPGIKSMIFAKIGCDVTVSHPSQEFLDTAKRMWDCLGLKAHFVRTPWTDSCFDDNAFDLVWNFCVYEHFRDPNTVIEEMLRVTRRYILLEIQNVHNIGLPIHRCFHALRDEPWDHGDMRSMDLASLRKTMNDLDARIIEHGATDMPPWPDINIGLREMLSRETSMPPLPTGPGCELRPRARIQEMDTVIDAVRHFEKPEAKDRIVYHLFCTWHACIESTVPFAFKQYFAHHPYLIAGKHDRHSH